MTWLKIITLRVGEYKAFTLSENEGQETTVFCRESHFRPLHQSKRMHSRNVTSSIEEQLKLSYVRACACVCVYARTYARLVGRPKKRSRLDRRLLQVLSTLKGRKALGSLKANISNVLLTQSFTNGTTVLSAVIASDTGLSFSMRPESKKVPYLLKDDEGGGEEIDGGIIVSGVIHQKLFVAFHRVHYK